MKKLESFIRVAKQTWKLWVGIIGLVFVVTWTAGIWRSRTAPGTIPHSPGIPLRSDASLIEVKATPHVIRIDIAGTVQSESEIHLSARIPAYIKDVLVSAGKRVKKGDLLVELDQREIREQLAAAVAQLTQAKMAYERARRLIETKATTSQDFEIAESAYKAANANVDRINVMISYTRIVSPIDGVVMDRRIDIGDLANPGQVLLSVYDESRMRLEVPVPARLVSRLPIGHTVKVTLEHPSAELKGLVSEVVSEVDPTTRTRLVKVRLDDPPANTLPGAYGYVWVDSEPTEAILLPSSCVYRVGQLEYVQVVDGERALRRLVKTGPTNNGHTELLSGVASGDKVLLNPVQQ
jgi:RND family efflux transporter MFP subunit